jgi:hypothetical protein
MVPPQSYFDVTTSAVDLNLTWSYPEYQPTFKYHAHNCYALLLAKYGKYGVASDALTFDFVDVQLYGRRLL